jgi:hypothetical protein
MEKLFEKVQTKDWEVEYWIILSLRREEADRAGSVLCLTVEYGTGHTELSVIAATGDGYFSGCEITSSFLISE